MPGAYSSDLRTRVLAAVEVSESPDTVAGRFMVGRATVYRWMAAARDEGRRTAKPMIGGPKPLIRAEVAADAGGQQSLDPDRMPRPAGGGNWRAGSSLDGGACLAAAALDVKEAQLQRR
jgi:hypothetical protein